MVEIRQRRSHEQKNDATSAPQILEEMVRQAERAGASDIHLQMRGKSAEVGFRFDGLIVLGSALPADVADRVFGRIKFLSRLKTYQESLPQDGRISHDEFGIQNDIRVATYPTITGEKIVLRLFNSSSAKSLHELSLPAASAGQDIDQRFGRGRIEKAENDSVSGDPMWFSTIVKCSMSAAIPDMFSTATNLIRPKSAVQHQQ